MATTIIANIEMPMARNRLLLAKFAPINAEPIIEGVLAIITIGKKRLA